MIAEAEQGQSTKLTCPFIDWEAAESNEEEEDEMLDGNSTTGTSSTKRCKLVLYSDSSESDN